jgi:hypothetical protein
MGKLEQLLDGLGLETKLSLEEIPKIDLYMDQVIQLFENKFADTKRHSEDKILTKTMINNYAKGKLLFPIKNKKYSKEHLILISLIYQLKGALSINDIKITLDGINGKIPIGDFPLDHFYDRYLHLITKNADDFKKDIQARAQEVGDEVKALDGEEDPEYLEQILMITSLVHMSNLYRKAAEKLVDEIEEKEHSINRKV